MWINWDVNAHTTTIFLQTVIVVNVDCSLSMKLKLWGYSFFPPDCFDFIVQNCRCFYSSMIILPSWPTRIAAVSTRWMVENQVLMIIWRLLNLSVGGLVNWLLEMINTSFFTQHYIISLQSSVADVGNDGTWNIQQQIQLLAQNSWPTCLVLNDFYLTLYVEYKYPPFSWKPQFTQSI